MAAKNSLEALSATIEHFAQLNIDAALKENLGDQSLAPQFSQRLLELGQQLQKIKTISAKLNEGAVRALVKSLTDLVQALGQISSQDPATFIQQRNQAIGTLDNFIDRVESTLLPFRVIAQEEILRGLLEPDAKEIQSTKETLRQEVDAILANVKREAEGILEDAKNKQRVSILPPVKLRRAFL